MKLYWNLTVKMQWRYRSWFYLTFRSLYNISNKLDCNIFMSLQAMCNKLHQSCINHSLCINAVRCIKSQRTFQKMRMMWTIHRFCARNLGHGNYGEVRKAHIDGLVQDCSISSALAMEILQCYTKPSIPCPMKLRFTYSTCIQGQSTNLYSKVSTLHTYRYIYIYVTNIADRSVKWTTLIKYMLMGWVSVSHSLPIFRNMQHYTCKEQLYM